MLSKRLTEVDVSTILTILQCTCDDNLFLVFPVLGLNYTVVSKISLVRFVDFPKPFEVYEDTCFLDCLLFPFTSKKENDRMQYDLLELCFILFSLVFHCDVPF